MWTPKRIVILSACFLAFFTVYLGYAYTFVGRIDGLPPLPEAYRFEAQGTAPVAGRPRRSDKLSEKLQLAFGANAKELNWAIRIDVQSKGMLLAAEQFEVRDGKVCLTPLSIAKFGKDKSDGLPPEIHTIRGEVAYLEFDRPVTNFSEIASRKITKAELSGRIEVVSNRRRAERDQDLRVTIPTGKVYYTESNHRLFTEAYVTLEDHKSKPRPHKITGKGMEMELQTEAQGASSGGRKANRETISGLNWIALSSTVKMDLYLESGAGLVAAKPDAKPADAKPADAKAKPAAQRSHLRIETPGCFRYDLKKTHDLASFAVAPAGQPAHGRPAPRVPQQVTVHRTNLQTGVADQLVCQHLTLRLKRREAAKDKPSGDSSMEGVEIETIHATAPEGKSVDLVSDTDHLYAHGQDFFHDAVRETTVLKGRVEVEKDESKMQAREVRIQNVYPPGTGPKKPGQPATKGFQHITAKGPGDILFVDKKEGKTLKATWQDVLTSTRDGHQDLLVLTGNARFLDDHAEQSLKGDVLKVWLEEAPAKQAGGEAKSETRRPRHLEATGHVTARSRDMNVHDTGRLVVWFKDVEAPAANLPAPRPTATTPGSAAVPFNPPLPQPLPRGPEQAATLTSKAGPQRPVPGGPQLAAPDKREAPRPFDLSARSVEAWVLRAAKGSSIDQLWCEGSVHVRQDPAKAEEKGTEVKGETLRMTGTGGGNYNLVVTGDLAELQTDKIYIVGPEVNIEQATNKAWVVGDGAMKMDSETNFQGDVLEKAVPLTVHWSKSMLFNGESAEFYGNIQATQEKARLACHQLQVYFTRPISLKQGNRTDAPARVRNLVCHKEVRIEDSVFEVDRLAKYQRLEALTVSMEALELDENAPSHRTTPKAKSGNAVQAWGPGNIRIWEPGTGADPLAPNSATPRATSAKPAAPPGEKMRMTYVAFGKMTANSKRGTAQFWTTEHSGVQVLHIPCSRHDAPINLDTILAVDLPENSLYIKCGRLKVLDALEAGKPNKQMEAHDMVRIHGRGFWANADSVYYNEQKQQIILEGKESGNAMLYKSDRPGAQPQTIEGKKLIYNRATGQVTGQGVTSTSGATTPRK
jgi:lipopolysaccharide export system protein LptA